VPQASQGSCPCRMTDRFPQSPMAEVSPICILGGALDARECKAVSAEPASFKNILTAPRDLPAGFGGGGMVWGARWLVFFCGVVMGWGGGGKGGGGWVCGR